MEELIQHISERFQQQTTLGKRTIVAISGVPGSGKSTLLSALLAELEQQAWVMEQIITVGMDGWHYSRKELDGFPDSKEAHERRGAAFTFNAEDYCAFVRKVATTTSDPIPFPSFSHSDRDPIMSGEAVLPCHRLVIIEGLHALLDIEPWNSVEDLYNARILINVPREVARERLVSRHMAVWPEYTREMATDRAEKNDLPNGDFLLEHLMRPTLVVTQ